MSVVIIIGVISILSALAWWLSVLSPSPWMRFGPIFASSLPPFPLHLIIFIGNLVLVTYSNVVLSYGAFFFAESYAVYSRPLVTFLACISISSNAEVRSRLQLPSENVCCSSLSILSPVSLLSVSCPVSTSPNSFFLSSHDPMTPFHRDYHRLSSPLPACPTFPFLTREVGSRTTQSSSSKTEVSTRSSADRAFEEGTFRSEEESGSGSISTVEVSG